MHIVYSGALGEKQKPVKLLEFLEMLVNNNNKIMCHIFSKGHTFEELKTMSIKSILEFV